MWFFLLLRLQAWALLPDGAKHDVFQLLDDWSDDAFEFLRVRVPRIIGVLIIAFILARLLRKLSRHLTELSNRQGLPTALRAQQLRTLSSVIYSVGVFAILFLAAMQILPLLGINMDHCWLAPASSDWPLASARRRSSATSSTAS